jgi:hypothetical protein
MRQARSAEFATTVRGWIVRKMRQFDRNLFESYRPELHYMRGPGPKWREKHGPRPATLGELGVPDLWNAGA